MPDLTFSITSVAPAERGMAPLLHFKLDITNKPEEENVRSIVLQAQIQIESAQRSYSPEEQKRLVDLFGEPERWGQTLRNRLWTHAQTTVSPFCGSTGTVLPVPCSYDLNLAVSKYLYGLEQGDVPLLFLFSGSVFYTGANGQLQVEQISWNKECHFRMPSRVWGELMEYHYPRSAWIFLQRDVFDKLYSYKCRHGLVNWEQTIERLLENGKSEALATGS